MSLHFFLCPLINSIITVSSLPGPFVFVCPCPGSTDVLSCSFQSIYIQPCRSLPCLAQVLLRSPGSRMWCHCPICCCFRSPSPSMPVCVQLWLTPSGLLLLFLALLCLDIVIIPVTKTSLLWTLKAQSHQILLPLYNSYY